MKTIKRRKLKKWVEYLLGGISIISLMLLACDSNNLKEYIISHVITLFIFIITNYILYKYSDLFED